MHRIGFIVSDGFQIMNLAVQSVFEYANLVNGAPFYAIENYSATGGEVRSSLDMYIGTQPLSTGSNIDTWIVPGSIEPLESPRSESIVEFLRATSPKARRTAGIGMGAFVLAAAGLLARRRATTHWGCARALQSRFPDIRVEIDRIYVVDGPIWTSAGMTAGLDLALSMVEEDLGAKLALSVARRLVMHQRRAGGQLQHSELSDLAPKSNRIRDALEYARSNLSGKLTVEGLAQSAHLSARQFSRAFKLETGQSPARAIESLRLEAARAMIEQSGHPLDFVATHTGFRDRRHMREAFIRGFGVTPQTIQRQAGK